MRLMWHLLRWLLERLKEMTLSSIALNLFDRDGDTSVVLDILALKLQEKYHLQT
ncbi:MAG: hypothetical protein ACLRMZ_11050 [Blautia marasmi]